jgi:lysophospholipase L1-like esterase
MKKNVIALFFSFIFSIGVLEIFLNLYNPFAPRIKGDQIILPVHKVYHISNDKLSRLGKEITHSRNGLGFRGPEAPEDINAVPSLICVGGSTTECYYLNDGEDWPAQVLAELKTSIPNIWVNNAGLDGHSTWGHRLLLTQHIYKLKPKFVLMLSGINDLGRADISEYDTKQVKKEEDYSPGIREWLIRNSQILNTIRTIRMGLQAQKQGVNHTDLDLTRQEKLEVPALKADSILISHEKMIRSYGKRLETIIQECKEHQIQLILMTQPMLWGYSKDTITGVDLSNIKIDESVNSALRWRIMEAYNAEAKAIAQKSGIPIIDLANKLEKSSEYFYDEIHFTPAGAQRIATIISPELKAIIQSPSN